MKKALKWIAISVVCLIVVAFFCFLYLIPPFTLAPQESFTKPERDAYPPLTQIPDPAERRIAERGKYLVQTIGCTGCHTPGGDKGPKYDTEFLAGGAKISKPGYGISYSRNLTPDSATGLGKRSTAQILRTLRCGIDAVDGRVYNVDVMPWAMFSHLTEEDRYAVAVFLRHLKPVRHAIPAHAPVTDLPDYNHFAGDYAVHDGK
jgi:mono/diheme cytochrome c family protein